MERINELKRLSVFLIAANRSGVSPAESRTHQLVAPYYDPPGVKESEATRPAYSDQFSFFHLILFLSCHHGFLGPVATEGRRVGVGIQSLLLPRGNVVCRSVALLMVMMTMIMLRFVVVFVRLMLVRMITITCEDGFINR
jgi:hypothetical protein